MCGYFLSSFSYQAPTDLTMVISFVYLFPNIFIWINIYIRLLTRTLLLWTRGQNLGSLGYPELPIIKVV
jgi:hypothetical protein